LRDRTRPFRTLLSHSNTHFLCCRRPADTRLLFRRSSLLMRCYHWSRPIDYLRHRRSYGRRHSKPCLQRPLRRPLFRLLRLLPSLIFESASLHPVSQLVNRRYKFSCQHDNRQQPQGTGAAAAGTGHGSPNVKFGGHSHAVAGYFTRSLGLCVEVEVFHLGRRVCVKVFASFAMLQQQPFSAYCNNSRRCHPLLGHVG